jgi:hypothetical protein
MRAVALAAAVLAATTLACSRGSSAVAVAVPNPGPAARRACEQLAQHLPESLGEGLSRRKTKPESPLVAAWGSPAAILRCGVPIDPGFKAGNQVIEVERDNAKVGWYLVKRGDRAVWSTPLATVHVELVVPTRYQGAGLLSRLTPAVSQVRVL